jgi:terminase large subunit-like protein
MGAIKYNDAVVEKWHRGDLNWKLHAAQKILDETFRNARGQLFVGNCSRQWGKSFWAVKTAIACARSKPKAQIRYGAAFQSDLEEFIIPAFDKILDDCPDELRPKFNTQKATYIFPNGSRIKLVGLDRKPNGLRGNTLDMIIVDECGFVTNLEYIYKSVIIPSTLHRPNCRIILISTPPATPAHPFVDYAQRAEASGGYVKLDIYSNPLITLDDIKRMADEVGGFDTTTFRREFLCEFVTDSDLAIIPEWNDKYVQEIERDEYFCYYDKYVGMDLGVKDLTAMLYGYYDFKRAALVIEDEGEMNGPSMNTQILVGAIKEKEKELWGSFPSVVQGRGVPYRRIADNNWPLMIADLSTLHSLNFIATDKDNLETMINELRLLVQSGRILIHPKCKKLIGCLRYGVWNEKKKAFARSSVYGHFDHLAALVYLARNIVTGTNPIPPAHGFKNHSAWLGNVKEQSKASANARTISKTLSPKPAPVNTSLRHRRRV